MSKNQERDHITSDKKELQDFQDLLQIFITDVTSSGPKILIK